VDDLTDWKNYYLKDNPFKETPYIVVELNDDRINGRLFSKEGFEKPYAEALRLIKRKKPMVYIRSDDTGRGTGKSALLAALYWDIRKSKELSKEHMPVWVSVHDFRTINQLMGRIVETFVFAGIIDEIKGNIGTVDYKAIKTALKKAGKTQVLSSEVAGLTRILELPNEELAWKYVNIRRSFPTLGSIELFTDLLLIFHSINPVRIVTFIDQFEEYVEYQYGQRLTQLANDIKDLYRAIGAAENLTFVVTMHPKTQSKFESRAQEIISTYGEVMDNAATVEPVSESNLIQMSKLYISRYRTEKQPPKWVDTYPFTPKAVSYIAKRSKANPRVMIRLMSNALEEAAYDNRKVVNTEYLEDPTVHSRVGMGATSA
jgi:hypothetical protein